MEDEVRLRLGYIGVKPPTIAIETLPFRRIVPWPIVCAASPNITFHRISRQHQLNTAQTLEFSLLIVSTQGKVHLQLVCSWHSMAPPWEGTVQ
jgi:hypothetical protein